MGALTSAAATLSWGRGRAAHAGQVYRPDSGAKHSCPLCKRRGSLSSSLTGNQAAREGQELGSGQSSGGRSCHPWARALGTLKVAARLGVKKRRSLCTVSPVYVEGSYGLHSELPMMLESARVPGITVAFLGAAGVVAPHGP